MDVVKKTQIEASKDGFKVVIRSDGVKTKVALICTGGDAAEKPVTTTRRVNLDHPSRRQPTTMELTLEEFIALPGLLTEFQGLLT